MNRLRATIAPTVVTHVSIDCHHRSSTTTNIDPRCTSPTMPGAKKSGGVSSKAEAGRAKKAENEARKAAEEQRRQEAAEAAEWSQGANSKRAAKVESAAEKADEAARKRREKAELLAAEEAELSGKPAKKAPSGAATKKGTKKKDDLGLLEDALVSAADKKVKMKRQDLLKKQEEQEKKSKAEEAPLDPLLANTERMLGAVDEEVVGRKANMARMEEGNVESGIDAALGSLNVSVPTAGGSQAKSAKALYNEFEARMLPEVKADYPGLRLTQYKEKVWNLWKKSPENPANQVP